MTKKITAAKIIKDSAVKKETKKPKTELEKLYEKYNKQVDEYKESIKDIKDAKKLEEMEQGLIKDQDSYFDTLKKKKYELSPTIVFDGKEYTRKEVGIRVCSILEKIDCEFSYTLGMYQMAKFWAHPGDTLDYSMLDSTARVLGNSLKYKGPNEWKNILIINEYFKSCNQEYAKDNAKLIFLANKHSALLDQMELHTPKEAPKETPAEEGPILMEEAEV